MSTGVYRRRWLAEQHRRRLGYIWKKGTLALAHRPARQDHKLRPQPPLHVAFTRRRLAHLSVAAPAVGPVLAARRVPQAPAAPAQVAYRRPKRLVAATAVTVGGALAHRRRYQVPAGLAHSEHYRRLVLVSATSAAPAPGRSIVRNNPMIASVGRMMGR